MLRRPKPSVDLSGRGHRSRKAQRGFDVAGTPRNRSQLFLLNRTLRLNETGSSKGYRSGAMVRHALPPDFPSVSQISLLTLAELVGRIDLEKLPALMARLQADRRRGCHELARRARRRWESVRRDRRRFTGRARYERRLWRRGIRYVAGVDEAGRGPLAGPVVAAAVILSPRTYLPGLDDSKVLSESARERLYGMIRREAVAVAVGTASAAFIDRYNIHYAGLEAMRRAVAELDPIPGYLLVDGFGIPGLAVPQRPLIRGDASSNAIAAASIVAKVHRDRMMGELDRRFPEYGFARHKGYGTAEHRQCLRMYGPTPEHRRSFTW